MATRKRSTSTTHVALLRGINVGGKNKVPMKQLSELFVAAGCTDVRTYIQSGNVVFCSGSALARRVPKLIRDAIRSELSLTVPVVTRSAAEMDGIVTKNPFAGSATEPRFLHVAFLADKPSRAQTATLEPNRSPPDEFVVIGSEVYLHFPKGTARSKLTTQYFDSRLGTTSTLRNWNTVRKLLAMCED